MANDIRIRQLDLGCFIRPSSETGGSYPRVEPVLGYLVRHERGLLLFDTGIGTGSPEADAHYRPHRRALPAALAAAGAALADITLVVNCHLHFDHCGGNPLLAGTPILVQTTELATARRPDGTVVLAGQAHDFDPRRVPFAHDHAAWEPPEKRAGA
ncbi:MBL fold metallo-hydrolase [Streptomyces sp. Rer75]|uniref:MBL fold metallo-hydrolase n=1 Tax=unclassified Streptomyces TaxID=2593676 RepID=UPI0015CFCD4B|nr:MBL fold metallo-hydrolase [Streptomyces sp. Rer75]QLH19597.1 MBL fold metallo-hydrolase [Streptomyces sp. Rer75]